MFNIKTAFPAVMLALLAGTAIAEPSPNKNSYPQCPTGTYDKKFPGVPEECIKCAAPACTSCHSERTDETVEATTDAERNCPPPVKPH